MSNTVNYYIIIIVTLYLQNNQKLKSPGAVVVNITVDVISTVVLSGSEMTVHSVLLLDALQNSNEFSGLTSPSS